MSTIIEKALDILKGFEPFESVIIDIPYCKISGGPVTGSYPPEVAALSGDFHLSHGDANGTVTFRSGWIRHKAPGLFEQKAVKEHTVRLTHGAFD